jgi:hypothetical protein
MLAVPSYAQPVRSYNHVGACPTPGWSRAYDPREMKMT